MFFFQISFRISPFSFLAFAPHIENLKQTYHAKDANHQDLYYNHWFESIPRLSCLDLGLACNRKPAPNWTTSSNGGRFWIDEKKLMFVCGVMVAAQYRWQFSHVKFSMVHKYRQAGVLDHSMSELCSTLGPFLQGTR